MAKPYSKLRHAMDDADLEREDICRALGKSTTYVAQRFQRKYPWTIEDAYTILQLLQIPEGMMTEFFPKGG